MRKGGGYRHTVREGGREKACVFVRVTVCVSDRM